MSNKPNIPANNKKPGSRQSQYRIFEAPVEITTPELGSPEWVKGYSSWLNRMFRNDWLFAGKVDGDFYAFLGKGK